MKKLLFLFLLAVGVAHGQVIVTPVAGVATIDVNSCGQGGASPNPTCTFKLTLTANTTLAFNNVFSGANVNLFINPSTFTLTWPVSVPAPTPVLIASQNNFVSLRYDGTAGTWLLTSGGGGNPGGSNTQIQYNNNGAFGGTTITWDAANSRFLAPNGTAAAPSYGFTNQTGTGMYIQAPGSDLDFSMAGARIGVLGLNYWAVLSNTGQFILGSGLDTSFSRVGAASVTFGTGTQGDSTGTFKTAGYISGGTTFTASGCANTTLVGGATAGKYTSVTGGACTVTITMGNGVTAPNGWACDAHDITTVADANNVTLGASNATTANLVEGTVAANDVIVFKCMGY